MSNELLFIMVSLALPSMLIWAAWRSKSQDKEDLTRLTLQWVAFVVGVIVLLTAVVFIALRIMAHV